MSDYISVHIVAGTQSEAEQIARVLVEESLVACANILPEVKSIYWWQGKVEEAREVLLIVKTRTILFEALAKRVKDLHSYDCPCIVSLPIMNGNADYLAWIRETTSTKPR